MAPLRPGAYGNCRGVGASGTASESGLARHRCMHRHGRSDIHGERLHRRSYPWAFRYVAATLSATVLIPWAGVVLYLHLTRSSRRKIMKALGLPVVYLILLGFGFVIGDASGMIPQ